MIIAKEIQLDMGHRVPNHHSKCRNLHGHRYKIVAFVEGPVIRGGSQEGMVLDFGFLKDVLMEVVHAKYDHTTVLSSLDPISICLVPEIMAKMKVSPGWSPGAVAMLQEITSRGTHGTWTLEDGSILHTVLFVPTAENMAIHWFDLLRFPVRNRSAGAAELVRLQVWETPTSMAEYAPNYHFSIQEVVSPL